jgi:DNA-binding MarR family transcriptional regulator
MSGADELLTPAHCISNSLQKTARAVARIYAEEMRASGLTRGQFPILESLATVKVLPLSVLARRLYLDRTTLTRNLTPLERDGLVLRPPDPLDARVRQVAISPAGRRTLRNARRGWKRAQKRVLERIGVDGWRTLETTLRDLRRAVSD